MSVLSLHLYSAPTLIVIAIANVSIGLFVLTKNCKSEIHRAFASIAIGSFIWISGFVLLVFSGNIFFDKIINYGGLLLVTGVTWFALVFPKKSFLPIRNFILFSPLIVAGIFIVPQNLIVSGIKVVSPGEYVPIVGPLLVLWSILLLSYILFSLWLLLQKFKIVTGRERAQLSYLLLGLSIFLSCAIFFDALLPGVFHITSLNILGPISSILFVSFTAYTILKHQLLDIRIIIQKGTIYSMLLSVIILFYIGVLLIISELFETDDLIASTFSAGFVTIIGILTVPHIEKYFCKITDGFFYKDSYNYANSLEELSKILNTYIDQTKLIPELLIKLDQIFKANSIVFEDNTSNSSYSLEGTISKENIYYSNFTLKITIGSYGAFHFSPKKSNAIYTPEDMSLLRTFSTQALVAFEKAKLYQQLQLYSASLEEKVKERTKEILEIQEKQKQLYNNISHALQTPLTVIKSALELLPTSIDETKNKNISIIERGVNDLSKHIEHLLNLAKFEFLVDESLHEVFDFSEVVKNILEYVEVICEQKNITLVSLITNQIRIFGDKKSIEESITNILSNAVRYTTNCKNREINVSLKKEEKVITFSVIDTGIGIPKESMPYIFDRFYTAQSQTGYGLGLTIVKQIIEQHKGSIQVSSESGRGTNVTIFLESI